MKGIKGELSSLSLTDLMQWIDMNRKTGVLIITSDKDSKCFCFEEGQLLMSGSKSKGGTFGEFLAGEGQLKIDRLRKAIDLSNEEGRSFVDYLVEHKVIPAEFLRVSIHHLAEQNMIDVLSWINGSFEFIENLPNLIAGSPIKLSTNYLVFESVRKYDELRKKQQGG